MSLFDAVKGFATDLFKLTKRVDKNTEDIEELRRNLKTLAGFSQKVANAIRRNQIKAEFAEKQVDSKYENLVLQLKVELYELERRLNASTGRENAQPRILLEGDDSSPDTEASSSEP